MNEAVNAAIAKLPKVSGGDGQTYVDPQLVRVLDEAEQEARASVPAEEVDTQY